MSPDLPTFWVGFFLLATGAGYALFAGADFGGGIWDLLAGGTERGREPRSAIDSSVTPVWEGNHVWIVLGITLLWTGFPRAFGAVFTALFVPLSLSLLGIVLRGIGFAFRHEAARLPMERLSGALFAASSLMAPFFLGACVGAVATGSIEPDPNGNDWGAWTSATAILTGILFISACAYISALYLIADSDRRGNREMVRYFQRRALAAGLVTGALGLGNLLLLHHSAPRLFSRLVAGPALPAVLVSVLSGLAALVLVVLKRSHLLRVAGAFAVIGVVAGWGTAQYPDVLPGQLTLEQAAAPDSALWAQLAVIGLALLLVLPSFGYLYWLHQHGRLQDTETSRQLREAALDQQHAEEKRTGDPDRRRHPVLVAAVIGAAVGDLVRDAVRRRGR